MLLGGADHFLHIVTATQYGQNRDVFGFAEPSELSATGVENVFGHKATIVNQVDYEQVRAHLLSLQKHHDNPLYQQLLTYLQLLLAQAKDQVLSCQPEERDWRIGRARAYRDLLAELTAQGPE